MILTTTTMMMVMMVVFFYDICPLNTGFLLLSGEQKGKCLWWLEAASYLLNALDNDDDGGDGDPRLNLDIFSLLIIYFTRELMEWEWEDEKMFWKS